MDLFEFLPENPTRQQVEDALIAWDHCPLDQMSQEQLSRQAEVIRPFVEDLEKLPKESLSKHDEWFLGEYYARTTQWMRNDAMLCKVMASGYLLMWPLDDYSKWLEEEPAYEGNPTAYEDVTLFDEQGRPYYLSTNSAFLSDKLYFPDVLMTENGEVNWEICTLNEEDLDGATSAYQNMYDEKVVYLPNLHKFVKRK